MKTSLNQFVRFNLLSLFMLFTLQATYAQRGGTPEQKAEKTTQRMVKKLGLSTDQATKMQAATLTFEKAKQTARTNRDKAAAQAARKTYHTEMKAILSSEQYKKFKNSSRKRRKRRKG